MRWFYDKLRDEHVVHTENDGTSVLFIDRHVVPDVTGPQAFGALRCNAPKSVRTDSE